MAEVGYGQVSGLFYGEEPRPCRVCHECPCECVATASFYLGEPIIDHAADLREAGGDGYGHVVGHCTCGAMWVSMMGSASIDHELWCRYHPKYMPVAPEGVRLEYTASWVIESKPIRADDGDDRIAYELALRYGYEAGPFEAQTEPLSEEAAMEHADRWLEIARTSTCFHVYALYR